MRIAALIPSLLVLSSATLPGATAEEKGALASQLRLMFVHTDTYEVDEEDAGGQTYTWNHQDPGMMGGGLQCMVPIGVFGPQRPLLLGVEAHYQHVRIAPASYSSGGVVYPNNDNERLTVGNLVVGGVLGWRFVQPSERRIGLLGEFQVMGGLTLAQGQLKSNSGTSNTGTGRGYDAAGRVLLGLQERGWMGAVSVGFRYGTASLEFDSAIPTSEVDLERSGLEILVLIGRNL